MAILSPPDSNRRLLDTLHQVLDGDARDARRDERRSFPYVQMLAPFDGRNMPAPEMFRQINCHDISGKSLTFFAPAPPNFDHLVLALGLAPFIFIAGRLSHFIPIDEGDQIHYLVDCKFLKRIRAE
jgi:hypothetical protein